MRIALAILKTVLFSAFAIAVGLFESSLFFSDLGQGETWVQRTTISFLIFILSGLIIGFFNPRAWALSALTAWGVMMLGLFSLATVLPNGPAPERVLPLIALMALPLGIALLSAYSAARFRIRRSQPSP